MLWAGGAKHQGHWVRSEVLVGTRLTGGRALCGWFLSSAQVPSVM